MRCKKQVYLKGVNFMKKLQRKILSTGISVTLLLGIISIPAVAEETTTDTQSSIVTNTITNSSIEKIEFEKDEEVIWECRNCGHIVVGTKAPELCPTCVHPQSYFEVHAENY